MQCSELLSRHNVLRSRDPNESEAWLSRDLCPHVLTPTDPESLRTVQNRVSLGFSKMMFVSYGTSVRVRGERLGDSYIVLLPRAGVGVVRIDSRPIAVGSGSGAVIAPEVPFQIDADRETCALIWRVDRYSVERLAGLAAGDEQEDAVELPTSLDLTRGSGAGLARAVLFVAQELNSADGLAGGSLILERLEEALTFTLLDTQPEDWKSTRHRSGRGAVPACVRRVEEYVAANIADGVGTGNMIRVSGVSGRTLFRAFRKFRRMSPQEYVRLMRLHRVREDLKRAEPGSTVTSVLSRWGVTQFGRFAAEYRRHYRELPSETHRGAIQRQLRTSRAWGDAS